MSSYVVFFVGGEVLSMVSTKFIHEYLVFLVIFFFLLLLSSRITTLILIHTWLFGKLIESMDRLPTDYLLYSFPARRSLSFRSSLLFYHGEDKVLFSIAIIIKNTSLPVCVSAPQGPSISKWKFILISLIIYLYSSPTLLFILFITATLLPDITEQFWIKFEVKASYKTNLLYYYLS